MVSARYLESAVNLRLKSDRSRKAISPFLKTRRGRDFQPRCRELRENLVIVISRVAGLFQRRKYNPCNGKYFPLDATPHGFSIVGIQEIRTRERSQRAIFTGNCRKQCSA